MATTNSPVSAFMTLIPLPVRATDTLTVAEQRMRTLGVHQLPVLSDRNVVGVLSYHDIALARSLGIDLDGVLVAPAMTAGRMLALVESFREEMCEEGAPLRAPQALDDEVVEADFVDC